ncbi:MAG: hypothetical protein LCH69_10070 [Proteobacteria bacterium]|nr:hypothetical protein [Pseudomonadota bacterium]
MTSNTASASATAFPAARRKPKGVLTQHEWDEMHDALTLALDALGDGPDDVDRGFLVNSILHQRIALRIAHKRHERLKAS